MNQNLFYLSFAPNTLWVVYVICTPIKGARLELQRTQTWASYAGEVYEAHVWMVKAVEQFLHFSAVPYPWPFNCGCPNMTSHVKAVVLHNWYQKSPPAVSSSFKTFVTKPNAIHNSKWSSRRVYSLQKHVSVSWWYEAWGFLLLQFTFSKLCQSWRLMNISRRFSSPQLHLNLLIDIGYMHISWLGQEQLVGSSYLDLSVESSVTWCCGGSLQ